MAAEETILQTIRDQEADLVRIATQIWERPQVALQEEFASALLARRLEEAGVNVIEARISHLAYAPEIAHAMLRRQQATAVIAARTQIVAGAVGMVKMALDELGAENIVELDEERKAAMAGNLLTVLCSEEGARPVLNTGSLYS